MAIGRTNAQSINTNDATAVQGDILETKTAYASGEKLTGTMVNRGAVSTDITTKAQVVTIAQGYHNGSGSVQISADEQAKIIGSNIVAGVSILGVNGTAASTDTSDATAVQGDILDTKTAYIASGKTTGSMTNRGAVNTDITTKAQSVTIQSGYHNGSGATKIATAEQDKIIGGNIKAGVTILGTSGTVQELTPLSVNNSISAPPTTSFNHTTQLSGWVGKTIIVRWSASGDPTMGDARIFEQTVTLGTSGVLIFFVVSSTSVRRTNGTTNTTINSTSTQVTAIEYAVLNWSIYEAI